MAGSSLEVELIATSSDEESDSDETFPSLDPRPELYFNLFDAYVGDYGAFATHHDESEPTAAHDSQSKGDSKVAAAHSSMAVGGFSAKENFHR